MVKVNFRTSDFSRKVANAGPLILRNRYFEENPFLSEEGASLLARPGLRKLTKAGNGPIRGLEAEAGSFNGDLFIASGAEMYRMNNTLDQTMIFSGLANPERGVVNMAITAQIGETPEFLFIADGRNLLVYMANGYAYNSLTGSAANNDTIRLDTVYYRWTSGSVDAGTPDGSSSNPWLVSLSLSNFESFTNMHDAINASGFEGVQYSTGLQANPLVLATTLSATVLGVRARIVGAVGNSIISTETGASLEWVNGGNFAHGGEPNASQVPMPDDIGAIDVAVIASYVIVIPVQTDGYQGRFYWIEPGETVVDPLNFATAERSPDGVFGVEVLGDNFWLPGESTTEVWSPTGNPDAPMRRLQGVVFDRGSWENTASAIHETLMLVDADGGVFALQGGSPQRVSTPDIEEEIRNAMALQNNYVI